MIELERKDFTKLLSPRLTVLVTSVDEKGRINAAPYSWVCPLSFSPPLLLLALQDRETLTKRNIEKTKEFSVNIVSIDFAQKAVSCEEKLPDASKRLKKAGLSSAESKKISVPHLKEAKAFFECKLSQIFKPKNSDHLLLIGEIVHAECSSFPNKMPELDELNFLMHVAGEEFRSVGKKIVLERKK